MAVRAAVVSDVNGRVRQVVWSGLLNTDTGDPVIVAPFSNLTVHADGVFGGATVALQGSNNNVAYGSLRDHQGVAIALTVDTIVQAAQENPLFVRPILSGGDANTNLVVTLIATQPGA